MPAGGPLVVIVDVGASLVVILAARASLRSVGGPLGELVDVGAPVKAINCISFVSGTDGEYASVAVTTAVVMGTLEVEAPLLMLSESALLLLG